MFKREEGEFVQILYKGSYHWVVVSNTSCTKNETNYYDSVFGGKIKDQVKMQICKMCKFFDEKFSVNVRASQQQLNGVDCGVYTLANAFHLILGVNIGAKKSCEDQIRSHLLKSHKIWIL